MPQLAGQGPTSQGPSHRLQQGIRAGQGRQPQAQVIRQVPGDEAGPRSSQGVSQQTGIRRAHGQAKQGCGGARAWHPRALLGQGLMALGWAEIRLLGPRAGMGVIPGEAGQGHSAH